MTAGRQGPIHIERRGPVIRATQTRQRGPEFHVAEFPHVERPAPHPNDARPIVLLRPQHPDIVEELRLLLIEQPMSRYDPGHEYLPRTEADGLAIPWAEERRTGLLLPAATVWERDWDAQWRTAVLVTPQTAGLPGTPADKANVAWRVLRQLDAATLARFAAAIAFRLEVWGPSSRIAKSLVGEMRLPPGPRMRVLAEISGGAPVFDPRCLRWIVQEVAIATVTEGWRDDVEPPCEEDAPAVELLERLLFGSCLGAGSPPRVAEIVRAIWLLHDAFAHDTSNELSGLEAVLSITGALGYAHRPRNAWTD